MKNLKYIILIVGVLITIQSCEDTEKIRFPEFTDAAVMRIQVDPDYGSLDASDIENAKIVYGIFTENDNILNQISMRITIRFMTRNSHPNFLLRPLG